MQKLSVIICTFNPVEDVFKKCLVSISMACSNFKPEEIIIVDNNSNTPLLEQSYIKDFLKKIDYAKLCVEKSPGLTPARLRGIKEATGNLLLFIDDDNFIKPNYFEQGSIIAENSGHIGSWSGQVRLLFEKEPESWTKKYWGLLVHREFTGNYWSNFPHLPDTMPCGAGLFVRKSVTDYYLGLHENGKRPVQLDRKGNSLFSSGDNDLAACACDIGLGVGIFDSLILDHYIFKGRTTREYLLRLAEGISASSIIFKSFRGEYPEPVSLKNKMANLLRLIIKNETDRQFQKAVMLGEQKAASILKQIGNHKF